jgi:HEAT repeat protein/ATP/ADP translocase
VHTTVLSALLVFAVVGAFVVLKSARDALFLGAFPATSLPYFLLLNALTSSAVGFAYARLAASAPAGRSLRFSLAVFLAGGAAFWLALPGGSASAIGLFYLAVGLFGTLVPVQSWSVVGETLSPRKARRILGLLGAGASLGGSAGGLLARSFSRAWGASALLPLAACFIVVAAATSRYLDLRQSGESGGREPEPAARPSPRFAALIVTVVALGSIASALVDFQFKAIAQREMRTAAELAGLFGSYYAWVELATLAVQVAALPFVLRSLPLAATLPLLPLVLAAGNWAVLAAASLPAALLTRAGDQVLRQSVDRSSREILYLALAPSARTRLKSLVETLGMRLPEAAAAVALIVLVSVGHASVRMIAGIALVLALVWAGAAIRLGREYPKVLKAAILHRDIDFGQARDAIVGRDFYRLLPDLARASSAETLLSLVELMRTTQDPGLGAHLRPLLHHRDPRVRHATLGLLLAQREDMTKEVGIHLSDQDLEVRAEAIHYLCARGPGDMTNALGRFLRHGDPRVRVAALACALHAPGPGPRQAAYERLREMLAQAAAQDQPDVRIEIAHVLGHPAPEAEVPELLRKLLADPDPAVRRAALRSAAGARPAGLVPDVVDALADPALRFEATETLRAYGEAALVELRALPPEADGPLARRKALVRALGETGDVEVAKDLVKLAQHREPAVAFAAIKGLNRLGQRVPLDSLRPGLQGLLDQELRSLEIARARARAFGPAAGSLMDRLLTQRRHWALERVFRVLGLLYDAEAIHDAYRVVRGEAGRRRDLALELLGTTLGAETRNRVLPLIETPPSNPGVPDAGERLNVLRGLLDEGDDLAATAAIAELTAKEIAAGRRVIEERVAASPPMVLLANAWGRSYAGGDMPADTHDAERREEDGERLETVQRIEHLGRVDLFSGLGAHELLVLAERSQEVVFPPGATIFSEGTPAADIYSVVTGRVELCREAGRVELLGAGDSFGTLAALTREPRFFTARAREQTRCLRLHRDAFWEIVEAYPRVAQGVIETLARKVEALTASRAPSPGC